MKNLRRLMLMALVIALAVVSGCSSRSGFGETGDCDYLIFPQMAAGGVIVGSSLVCDNTDVPLDMEVNVVLRSPGSDVGGLGDPPEPTDLSRFQLTHYDVTYRNLNTNGTVQGVDVPFAMRQNVPTIFDMEEETELTLDNFPVMRSGAKSLPPLNDDSFYPNDAGVMFEAQVTFWGHPVTDANAWCYGTFTWNFTVVPC